MKSVTISLTGRTEEDFRRYCERTRENIREPAKATDHGIAVYLVRRGLESERKKEAKK